MAKPRILVADDEEDIVITLRFGLEQEGYEVITASDGEGALECARNMKPDAILLDVMMPKENGYRVARKIRDHEKSTAAERRVPIILLTARDLTYDPKSAEKVMEFSQADKMIYKPFDLDAVIKEVRNFLER